jgi:N-acetylglutamate synthase
MPDPRIEDLERAAALHWQAPETESLGEWRLRAADGFTGRANSALPLGDPGLPLPEAVTAVEEWYRRRALLPMIVVPKVLLQGTPPDPLEDLLAERGWVPRPGPRAASCFRSRRATPRLARSTSGAGSATPIVTIT